MKDSKILAILICLQIIFVTFVPSGAVHLGGNCTDFEGRSVLHGQMYVPGPWICIHCICYNSKSTSCGRLRCSIPAKCKKFRFERRCCNIECLNPTEDPIEFNVTTVDDSPRNGSLQNHSPISGSINHYVSHSHMWTLSLLMVVTCCFLGV
ncbi:uncharacterized protein LOC126927049 isoform X2 [Bombus affinis]|uniref:uncharacterized protein LOC126927049 isoform X2 n=1 Tax=Bombus affinis TaxID=309941 RepID=UPI0021B7B364|nr:uncharacterized protein LOC126927049 isoform X2 [Bombus affinis]